MWVRETWQELYKWLDNGRLSDESKYYYAADGEPEIEMTDDNGFRLDKFKWRPSIHMPKEAARIFLEVTDLRVERVQDITEEDALKEGFSSRLDFRATWNSIYNNWNENPYVWVIEFERCDKP